MMLSSDKRPCAFPVERPRRRVWLYDENPRSVGDIHLVRNGLFEKTTRLKDNKALKYSPLGMIPREKMDAGAQKSPFESTGGTTRYISKQKLVPTKTSPPIHRISVHLFPSEGDYIISSFDNLLRQFHTMARQGQSLEVKVVAAAAGGTPFMISSLHQAERPPRRRPNRSALHLLQQACRLGIVKSLICADPSLWQSQLCAYFLIFEILANTGLERLQVNLPHAASSSRPTTILASLGHAIRLNPSLKHVELYAYQDMDGVSTATVLEALGQASDVCRKNGGGLTSLHLYCPLHITPTIMPSLTRYLSTTRTSLLELEITGICHHTQSSTTGSDDTPPSPQFPLRRLVQEGLIGRSDHETTIPSCLERLSLRYCELTTLQVDEDLLAYLHHLTQIRSVDLMGNLINRLDFSTFLSSAGVSCRLLESVSMNHNPWQYNYFYNQPTAPQEQVYPFQTDLSKSCLNSPCRQAFFLKNILQILLERHPKLIYFGVDPMPWLPQLTLWNQSGIRRSHHHHHEECGIELPAGIWARLLAMDTQQILSCSSSSSRHFSSSRRSGNSTRHATKRSHHSHPQQHQHYHHHDQASWIYHLLQTYHPWMILSLTWPDKREQDDDHGQ